MKSRIITIAGTLGSGKSSTAKRVAAELGYSHFSSGDLFRAMAAERGISVEEINLRAEIEHEIDHAVDERLKEMALGDRLVVDSRLAFHWMPDSYRVFLDLNSKTAAKRIFTDIKEKGRESQMGDTEDAIYENTLIRRGSEVKRFINLYNVDLSDLSLFDLVVDTEKNNLDAVVEIVLDGYRSWYEGEV